MKERAPRWVVQGKKDVLRTLLFEFDREEKRKEVDQIKQWWIEERAKKAVEKLVVHEFDAVYAKTKEEAVQELWKHITPKQKIGVGEAL